MNDSNKNSTTPLQVVFFLPVCVVFQHLARLTLVSVSNSNSNCNSSNSNSNSNSSNSNSNSNRYLSQVAFLLLLTAHLLRFFKNKKPQSLLCRHVSCLFARPPSPTPASHPLVFFCPDSLWSQWDITGDLHISKAEFLDPDRGLLVRGRAKDVRC